MARKKSEVMASATKDAWASLSLEKYREIIPTFVHFSTKTVNTNTKTGIRLGPDQALDLPYVAARTMLQTIDILLDYCEGGAVVSRFCSNMHAILRGDAVAEQANQEERNCVMAEVATAKKHAYTCETAQVDHRLRQLLLPKPDSEEGYVAVTPVTSSGLCDLLLGFGHGLVNRHNDAAWEERKSQAAIPHRKRVLQRALLKVGGSKPMNVGYFAGVTGAMQRPLFLGAPRTPVSRRTVFSLYYNGIRLDFGRGGNLYDALCAYLAFRKKRILDRPVEEGVAGIPRTNLAARQEEERLVRGIALTILEMADHARQCLLECQDILPMEQNGDGSRALCSPQLPWEIRGLLDTNLRDNEWPRKMARLVGRVMENAHTANEDPRLVLDGHASAHLASILEEAFQ